MYSVCKLLTVSYNLNETEVVEHRNGDATVFFHFSMVNIRFIFTQEQNTSPHDC